MTYTVIALYLLAMPAVKDSARKGGIDGSLLHVTVILWPVAMIAFLIIKAARAIGFERAKRMFRQ